MQNQYRVIDPDLARRLSELVGGRAFVLVVDSTDESRVDIYNVTRCPEHSIALLEFAMTNCIHSRPLPLAAAITADVARHLSDELTRRGMAP